MRGCGAPWIHRKGVLAHQPSATDLLFITLRKSEALFSPSTRYRDLVFGPCLLAITRPPGADRPHWQRPDPPSPGRNLR